MTTTECQAACFSLPPGHRTKLPLESYLHKKEEKNIFRNAKFCLSAIPLTLLFFFAMFQLAEPDEGKQALKKLLAPVRDGILDDLRVGDPDPRNSSRSPVPARRLQRFFIFAKSSARIVQGTESQYSWKHYRQPRRHMQRATSAVRGEVQWSKQLHNCRYYLGESSEWRSWLYYCCMDESKHTDNVEWDTI